MPDRHIGQADSNIESKSKTAEQRNPWLTWFFLSSNFILFSAFLLTRQKFILNNAHFLPYTGIGDESRVQYEQTLHALDEFMRKYYNEWTSSLDSVSNL
jgi:hypothetical protein